MLKKLEVTPYMDQIKNKYIDWREAWITNVERRVRK